MEAATAFLHQWAAFFGIPSEMSSDNGASFVSNLWKDMMSKLNIKVKYSALYRPESIGMLERQHRGLKDSLKAALVDMGEKHTNRWIDHLPFVLLGRRVALQPDIGASASELTFGMNVRIPGQLLHDPGNLPSGPELQNILQKVKNATNTEACQPSRHNKPEAPLKEIPPNITHVYTRQHQTTGLQTPFEGPFRIEERVSRSVIKIEVGTYKDGRKRYELRHLNDIKLAHPESLAAPASRPALGRPSVLGRASSPTDAKPVANRATVPESSSGNKQTQPVDAENNFRLTDSASGQQQTHATSNQEQRQLASSPPEGGKIQTAKTPHPDYIKKGPLITEQMFREWTPELLNLPPRPVRSTRNPNPVYVDSIESGAGVFGPAAWSASVAEIKAINNSINSRP